MTESSLHHTEPHAAYLNILAHESIWLDSELIPLDIQPLLENKLLNTSHNNKYFDINGNPITSDTKQNQRVSSVKKHVRLQVDRGEFGEYFHKDLRQIIHNYSPNYSFVIEYEQDNNLQVFPSHLCNLQAMSGVVTLEKNLPMFPPSIYVTGYFYCGRVGIDRRIKDPTTDDIEEGVTNKYFTKQLMMSHLEEALNDNNHNFVLSVADSDALKEGVYNKFFNQINFDNAFNAKSISDLSSSDTNKLVNNESMLNLNLSIGSVPEIGFTVNSFPPNNTSAKLYVERGSTGNNILYFEDSPVGAVADNQSTRSVVLPDISESHGEFSGNFEGPTRGLHTGDVKGNVQGYVSSLANHPIIEAKILGNGEGHWTGTVNGDVVGKFEGHAKIMTGSVDNASHITVGTFDSSDSSIHIKSSDTHLKFSNIDGSSTLLQSASDACLLISCSSLQTTTIKCTELNCTSTLIVNDLVTNNFKCSGLVNSFYGIFEAGRIEDVSEIVGDIATLSICNSELLNTVKISCAESLISRVSVSDGFLEHVIATNAELTDVNVNKLSVSDFHVENLSFDHSLFLETPDIVFNTLSVSEITSENISSGNVVIQNLTVESGAIAPNIFSENIHTEEVTTRSLSVSELHFPNSLSLNISVLSVQNLSAYSTEIFELSVNNIVTNKCTSDLTHTIDLEVVNANASHVFTNSLSASSVYCNLVSATVIESLSVSILNCDTTDLSVMNLKCENAEFVTLSSSAIYSENISASHINSEKIDVSSIDVHELSVQGVTAHRIITEYNTIQQLSASSVTLQTTEALSIASEQAEIRNLSSNVHTCQDLSVSSSHTLFSNAANLSVSNTNADWIRSTHLSTAVCNTNFCTVKQSLSCAGSITALHINTPTIHTQLATSDVINTSQLSTHSSYSQLSILGLLSVSNATLNNTFSSLISCSKLNCDDISAPRATFDILSVHSIVGVEITRGGGGGVTQEFVENGFLSISQSVNDIIDNALLSVSQSIQDIDSLNSLSCSFGIIDRLHGNTLSVSEIRVSALSVATLHGIVLTQELSVTGLVGHISSSSITTSDLSCGTIFVNNLVRSVPHISDTSNPAVLTTSTLGDFALFSQDSKHSGDMVIEGSLYVTDTIFMGTQPSLNIENVQNMVASSISVGELAVGMLTGIGGGTLGGNITDVVTNLLSVSPHDTIHEGNMQIEGNLVVSGVVLTGAHNKLMHNHGSFDMQGNLSVSGDIFSNRMNLVETVEFLLTKLVGIEQQLTSITLNMN